MRWHVIWGGPYARCHVGRDAAGEFIVWRARLADPMFECFEELDRTYANSQLFAEDSRRLAAEGWMISRVTERKAQQSIVARMRNTHEPRFKVTYERLVRHGTDGAES
jgi:hypothetical protein